MLVTTERYPPWILIAKAMWPLGVPKKNKLREICKEKDTLPLPEGINENEGNGMGLDSSDGNLGLVCYRDSGALLKQ